MAKQPEKVQNQLVDAIMGLTLKDVGEEDVDSDPLVQLGCGHVHTTSTLDGLVELNRYTDKRQPFTLACIA